MDIRGWPLDQIMQLPDCCFGRRWPIVLAASLASGAGVFVLDDMALPERCVIWELHTCGMLSSDAFGTTGGWVALKLGDQFPAAAAGFIAMEDLLRGAGVLIAGILQLNLWTHLVNLRVPVESAGRRVVARLNNSGSTTGVIQVSLVFSSIPKEVPDCLISEYLRSR